MPSEILPFPGLNKGTSFLGESPTLSNLVVFTASNWMEYLDRVLFYVGPTRERLKASIFVKKDKTLDFSAFIENETRYTTLLKQVGYYAMQHYFQNGGGYCHVAFILSNSPVSPTLPLYDTLADYIAGQPDITLFCPVTGVPEVDAGLIENVTQNPASRLFCLTAGHLKDTAPAITLPKNPAQTAAYYPWLSREAPVLEDLSPRDLKVLLKFSYDGEALLASITYTKLTAGQKKQFDTFFTDRLAKPVRMSLSPVPAVAGAYCVTDSTRGVWKAPANIPLAGVSGLCDPGGTPVFVTDTLNETLAKKNINGIRAFHNEGYRIWGARTLAGAVSPDWCYVPVRRLFNSAETEIRDAMQTAIFEPNTSATWEIVRGAIDHYLYSLWQQGALAGSRPEDAYFVLIGTGVTMSTNDVANGRMSVNVGMAAVRPAEFIQIEFSQMQLNSSKG